MRHVAVRSLVLALALGSTRCHSDESEGVANVRLGMAPRDVRDRFQPGAAGGWQTAVGSGDDTVLEWTSRTPKSTVAHARFEFHLGMLVAVRARTTETTSAEKVSVTPKTVTVRAPLGAGGGGGTSVTMLARDCPTHKAEAESLATKAR